MNAARVIDAVKAAGGRIELASQSRLRLQAPQPLPPALVEQLRKHKTAILVALRHAADESPIAADQDAHAERVALLMANGVPEEWAEGLALLDNMPCPPSMIPVRWEQVVNDAGLFLDQWGVQAAALGWRALDVFGVCAAAPHTHYAKMGLVWLLAGRSVCAITADTARIDCGNGITQTYRRTPFERGAVPLWAMRGT